MTIKDEKPIDAPELRIGKEMSYITFGELIKELTGEAFEEVYKDIINHGELKNAEGKME